MTEKPRMGIRIGDVVQLKSGGPDMVVEDQDEMTGDLLCSWFDGSIKVKSAFAPHTLVKVQN
jgi:uncharacterized protein YodC (DUF2158 family)